MPCEEFEIQIADYVENQLLSPDRARVAAHLAVCADCHAFAQQLEQLDVALLRTVKAPPLPATFKAKLQRRLQTTVVLSEIQRVERKRQMQAEYEAGLARLNRFPLPPRKLLESLGHGGLIALAGWLAWQFLPQLGNFLAESGWGDFNQSVLFAWLVSVICLVLGLTAAFPMRVRRIFSAV
ncbi:MAG: zf-HC2 domain-containing protein [Akkermansiaceae bacterium]|nr:zf-HC2 domain-containing protein [Verrucomicrobiales bacterium]